MIWNEKRLDELGQVSRGKSRHRPRDAAHLYGGPYPFIQTGDVKHANLYITEYNQTYSEEGLAQSKLWPKGTLCITIAANIADTAILQFEACFPDSIIGFIPEKDKADAIFIKYLFDALLQRRYKTFTQGAAQDNLSQSKLLSLKFPVPDIDEQKRIANFLMKYDQLIENNLRRISLLEKSAHLLYKEWFLNLRFPGHEYTPISKGVPEGWEIKKMAEVIELKYGKALKQADRKEGPYPVFGSSGIVGYHNKPLVKGPGIIVGRKGNVGSVFLSYQDFYPIDTVYFALPTIDLYYSYYTLKSITFYNSDAAVPGLNRNYAHSLPILVPSGKLIKQFRENIKPIHDLIFKLNTLNNKLKHGRDLLLPKLMNGEIRV